MIVKEISVEFMFTKSLPNFQNVKPSAGVTITLEDGDDLKETYKKAWEIVGGQIKEQLKLFEGEKKGIQKGF